MNFDFYKERILLVTAVVGMFVGLVGLVIAYLTSFPASDLRSNDASRLVCISEDADQCTKHFLQRMAREKLLFLSWTTASGGKYYEASTNGEYNIMPEYDGVCVTFALSHSSRNAAGVEQSAIILCHRDGEWVISDV